jgi:phosphatidate cytidylyltransferase
VDLSAQQAIGYFLGFLTPLSTTQVLFVSFMIAFSGFIGDIVMSSVKRDIGVKEYGLVNPRTWWYP